jgi:hypothetical protein
MNCPNTTAMQELDPVVLTTSPCQHLNILYTFGEHPAKLEFNTSLQLRHLLNYISLQMDIKALIVVQLPW